jgi:hypothetical protein
MHRQNQAFGFGIVRKQRQDRTWAWLPDADFAVVRDAFDLPIGGDPDGGDIAAGRLSTAGCDLRVVHHTRLGSHRIGDGVPERDKFDAFRAVAAVIEDLGFEPLASPQRITVKKALSPCTAKPVKPGALLHEVANGSPGSPSRHLSERLESIIGYGLEGFEESDYTSTPPVHEEELARARDEHERRLARRHPMSRALLLVLLDPLAQLNAPLVNASIRSLYGDAFDVKIETVPDQTFGYTKDLDGSGLPAERRYEMRVQAWAPLVQRLAAEERPVYVLVVARQKYANGDDDEVNKNAAKRTLASRGRVSVQFLTPPKEGRPGTIKLRDFSYRLQAALRDLVYGHAGEVEIPPHFSRAFAPEFPPREILGFTLLRQNATRLRADGQLLPIAFRLDLESGCVEAQVANLIGGGQIGSGWVPLREALMDIAGANPSIPGTREGNALAIRTFIRRILSSSVAHGRHPLVVVKTSMEMTGIWQGLKDSAIHRAGPLIEENGRAWEDEYPGARLIRIRQNCSPRVIGAKRVQLKGIPADDAAAFVEAPTRAPGLFVVPSPQDGFATYWSVGNVLAQVKRGLSCYRALPVRGSSGNSVIREAHRKDWPAPATLEITLGAHVSGDVPDRIAAIIHALRFGYAHHAEATALPAPIFFENKFRNYLGDFSLIPDFDEDAEG